MPAVEVPHYPNGLGRWCPNGKINARNPVNVEGMGTELLIYPEVGALVEKVKVKIRKETDLVKDLSHLKNLLGPLRSFGPSSSKDPGDNPLLLST